MPKTADKPTLNERDHRVGCAAARIERYEVTRPDSQGGGVVTVIRCIDCGGHKVDGSPIALDGWAQAARKRGPSVYYSY